MTEHKLPIGFRLANIITEQFAIIETAYKEDETKSIQLHSSFKFGFNEDDQSILASPRFSFDQSGVSFIILEVACIYKIEIDSWQKIFNEESKCVTLPKDFAAHLAAIAVGIARGVLHAKTEKTLFTNLLIPLINVAENIEEDVVLQL